VPLVAWAAIVAEPVAVAMLAPTRIVALGLALGAICNGLAGFVATPGGSPEIATATVPEKLFFGVIEIVTDCGMPPCVRFSVAGDIAMEKSGVAAEVGAGVALGKI
jgi:hypothetical protein